MTARERFEKTRNAIERLNEIKLLIMYECDDWKPPSVKAKGQASDPTGNKAAYNVDELGVKLEALRNEERELEEFIGVTLAIIRGVREGFGEVYANLLEWCYIDGLTMTQISEDKKLNRTYCYQLIDVAFDWIDSVGVSRIIGSDYEV